MLQAENQRLRERVAELEQAVAEALEAGAVGPAGQGRSKLLDLLHEKNRQLAASAAERNQKAREVGLSAHELAAKNEALTNSLAALRLYQLMFENDPHGLVGADPHGQIIQFNSSAIRFFGYDLHKLRLGPLAELKMHGADLDLAAMFSQAMAKGEAGPCDCGAADSRVRVSCYRMEDIRGVRGVVFRLTEIANA